MTTKTYHYSTHQGDKASRRTTSSKQASEIISHQTKGGSANKPKHLLRSDFSQENLNDQQYYSKKHRFVMNAPLQMTSPMNKFLTNQSPNVQQKKSFTNLKQQVTPVRRQLEVDNYPPRRKHTSEESTVSDKQRSSNHQIVTKAMTNVPKSPSKTYMTTPTQEETSNFLSYPIENFSSADNSQFQKKTDIQVFKNMLDEKLQKIQFFIDKAEQAKTERQRSSSLPKRRQIIQNTFINEGSPITTCKQQLQKHQPECCPQVSAKVEESEAYTSLVDQKKSLSQQSSYVSTNFYPPPEALQQQYQLRRHTAVAACPQYDFPCQRQIVEDQFANANKAQSNNLEIIDTIQDNELSASEEENRILQLLSYPQQQKKNERYKTEFVSPSSHQEQQSNQISPQLEKTHQLERVYAMVNPEEISQECYSQRFNDGLRPYNDCRFIQQQIQSQNNQLHNQQQQEVIAKDDENVKIMQQQQYENYVQLKLLEERQQELNKINLKITEENAKMVQKYKHLQKKVVDLKCRCKVAESQSSQQTQNLIMQQNERSKLIMTVQVQEDQLKNLKYVLNQSLDTKIKYENVFKKLLEDDICRDQVLALLKM